MLKHENLIRQMAIIPMDALKMKVTVIGAGAIGSHVVKSLAQMGMGDITVFDDDVVSFENMNAQGFGLSHVGKPKVEALADIVKEYTGIEITAKRERYKEGRFDGIVVSAVDNMATRKLIWDEHKAKAVNCVAFIDPRMGAENAMLFHMNPMNPVDQKTYEKGLYSDDDAVREPCTAKATIYTALLLSGLVCKAVKDVITEEKETPLRTALWNIRGNDLEIWGTPKPAKETLAAAKPALAEAQAAALPAM